MAVDLVVIGLGYVGLPLAHQAARSGLTVAGFDVDPTVVAGLNEGRSHIDDLTDDDVAELLARGFVASTDPSVLDQADAVTICVPTPLSPDGRADLRAVEAAAEEVGRRLRPGMLVVLESTSYPGTTNDVVRPIL